MQHILHLLAVILIGTALGAIIYQRNNFLLMASVAAIAVGAVAIFMHSWVVLAIGTAIFLAAQALPRGPASARA